MALNVKRALEQKIRNERILYILRRTEGFSTIRVVYNEKTYRVQAYLGYSKFILVSGGEEVMVSLNDFKPILRELDSMTKEESKDYDYYSNLILQSVGNKSEFLNNIHLFMDWIDDKNFDDYDFIGRGYAISEEDYEENY